MANYTPNYRLHQWQPQDPFLRTDFNEDLKKIDQAIPKIITGSYVGDGAQTRTIPLEHTPSAVYVCTDSGSTCMQTGDSFMTFSGGLAVKDHPIHHLDTTILAVAERGFQVCSHYVNQGWSYSYSTNVDKAIYHYIAFC